MNNWEIYTYLKAKKGGSGGQSVTNPALRLIDWEGTVLKEYSAEQVASLTTLPTPSSLRADVDRDLLTFQGYNWALADIKAWATAHEGECLQVGAIYTTTDGEDHNYWNNPRLTTAATISKHKRGTTIIKDSAFNSYYSLTSISLPEGVTTIRNSAFIRCYSLTSISIPEGVTSIEDNAFSGCVSLASISLPKGVTSIGGSAFNYCYSLTNLSLPEGVTTIGNSAFNNCYSLASISIPEGVTSIGDSAFYNCYSLTDIVIKGTPTLANTNAVNGIYKDYLIYVPKDYLSFYSSATNWTQLYEQGRIVAIEDYIDYLKSIGIDVREFEGE